MNTKQQLIILGALAILISGLISLGNAQASDLGSERDLCLQDCRQWIGEFGGFKGGHRGRSDSQYRLYALCVERCERRFWKEFDNQFKEE
jgi:hypothetical protein